MHHLSSIEASALPNALAKLQGIRALRESAAQSVAPLAASAFVRWLARMARTNDVPPVTSEGCDYAQAIKANGYGILSARGAHCEWRRDTHVVPTLNKAAYGESPGAVRHRPTCSGRDVYTRTNHGRSVPQGEDTTYEVASPRWGCRSDTLSESALPRQCRSVETAEDTARRSCLARGALNRRRGRCGLPAAEEQQRE